MILNEFNRRISDQGGLPTDTIDFVIEEILGEPGYIFDTVDVYVDKDSGEIVVHLDIKRAEVISAEEINDKLNPVN